MARVFAENSNRDIYLGSNNQLAVNVNLDAIIQACKAAVEIQLAEAIYSQQRGVPNYPVIWAGTPNFPQFEFFTRKQILNIPGVISIDDFSISQNGDVLSFDAVIKTIYGTGSI